MSDRRRPEAQEQGASSRSEETGLKGRASSTTTPPVTGGRRRGTGDPAVVTSRPEES
uniref:Uncharacterized protein n=1 Tax=Arundo donax TaxID=35708 RepID=A0A0A9BX74_ARUDO